MKLSPQQLLLLLGGVGGYFSLVYFVDRALPDRLRWLWRYGAAVATIGAAFWGLQEYLPNHDTGVSLAKFFIPVTAAGCVFYEQYRKGLRRPVSERWAKFVGVTLALAGIAAYFNGFRFGYPPYYHRWDQYHYYMGAKYFPELAYTDLYKCAVIAQDELGTMRYETDRPWGRPGAEPLPRPTQLVDMRAEMRDPDKKVRDLGGENLLVPVRDILGAPESCKDKFSPERWEEYKGDVAFFRITSGKGYWTDMQKDHGFNPPPVWTIMGKFFSDMSPTNVQFMQFLASLDLLYLMATFVVLWWGFGWRVFAVAGIFWGCQSSAPFYWTGGAFLRQDWLFYTALSVACLRKRCFKLAGAALVYAGLLRIFPGLVVLGTLVPFVAHLVKHRRVHPDHGKMLLGGVLAAAVLVPVSLWVSGKRSYLDFYKHTLQTHDQTPLTNHMGLRVIVSHKFFDFHRPGLRDEDEAQRWKDTLSPTQRRLIGWTAAVRLPVALATGKSSGQMEYVRDNSLVDPFEVWKRMRNERYAKYRWISYAIVAASLGWFVWIVRKIRSLWVAQCLGQIFVILLSQLTCYYYSFMILAAPLTRLRKQIEVGLFALAAVTQIIWMNSYWNDNKYTLLTIASLVFSYIVLGLFWRRRIGAEQERTERQRNQPDRAAAAA
jgi:hypothetical protein